MAQQFSRRSIAAFVAGFEVQTRVAVAAGPGHYDVGWHVTGTVGHIGAAVTTARLLGLSGYLIGDGTVVAADKGRRSGIVAIMDLAL